MPINEKTHQYMGILHGGASVVLAETIGSIGSYLLIDRETQYTVGLEVNANHVGSAREGMATAKARIIHKGKKTHVWSIEISDDNNKLLSICRLTTMIITK
jgi:1,4-dihydroxy-2-naphthoyl-CoA hydrolase